MVTTEYLEANNCLKLVVVVVQMFKWSLNLFIMFCTTTGNTSVLFRSSNRAKICNLAQMLIFILPKCKMKL